MAFERTLAQVSQAFTANGGNGFVQVADTNGFYVKCKVLITSNTHPNLTLEIKRIVTPNIIYVGLPGNIENRTDVSAYLVSDSAEIIQFEQPKPIVAIIDQQKASWAGDPVVAHRVLPVDQYGNTYNPANTLPVNIIPQSQIPFSLMMLAFPAILAQELGGLTYDQVTSTTVNGQEVLSFYLGGTFLTSITLTQTAGGWTLGLGTPGIDFLLLENGAPFELENGTGGILLEK